MHAAPVERREKRLLPLRVFVDDDEVDGAHRTPFLLGRMGSIPICQ